MDYEGNLFPDEEEEELPRSKRIRKKAVRYFFYSIIILVYLVAFWFIFTNCDSDIYEEYDFSPSARELYEKDPDNFKVYEIFPPSWMNYDGSVQIAGTAYAEAAGELEFCIKYNKNLLTNDKGETPEFSLVDTYGKVYKLCNTIEDNEGRYRFLRVSFSGVKLDLQDNVYINNEASTAVEGEGEMYETFSYKLLIHYPENADIKTDVDDEDISNDEIIIYNSNVPIQLGKYE